jgi:hypothetical protein
VPRLVKGGKWVYGWSIVDAAGAITIPRQAFAEYRFTPGESALVLQGSGRSGGFAIALPAKLAESRISLSPREAGRVVIGKDRRIAWPGSTMLGPGERLLAVRGSGLGLGFVQRGPIYEEALRHPEVEEWR